MVKPVSDGSTVLQAGALAVTSLQPDAHAPSGLPKTTPPTPDPPVAAPAPEPMAPPIAEDLGQKVAEELRAALSNPSVGVIFKKQDEADQPVIQVINRDTGDVIRQIPPEEVLELRQRFSDLVGMMKDLKA